MFDSLSAFPVALVSSFSLIGLAEIGDKSQLVCMALAARYRAAPVFLGAIIAFAILNIIAVIFGATVAHWLPQQLVILMVGLLFLGFGIHALWHSADEEDDLSDAKTSHGLFISTLLLITLAEFGDKTQLAVAGLSSTSNPYAVWLGATLALVTTTALGIWLGRKLVQRISLTRLHQLSGALFILLGLLALLTLVY